MFSWRSVGVMTPGPTNVLDVLRPVVVLERRLAQGGSCCGTRSAGNTRSASSFDAHLADRDIRLHIPAMKPTAKDPRKDGYGWIRDRALTAGVMVLIGVSGVCL